MPPLLARLALVVSLYGLVACSREEPRGSAPAAPASSEPVLIESPEVDPPALTFTPPRDEPAVRMPGPFRKRLAAALTENASCLACHDEVAREWRGSYHQRANVDPAYVKAFAIEPSPFCRSCHAPEADPTKEPPVAVSELGVGCVTCHVTEDGLVLAADRPEASARPAAPHPVRRSKAFAHQGACAGCHEFRFPMPGGPEDEFFMQTTAREHLRSPAAEKGCAECHMPLVGDRRSHSFAHVRDPAWLRKNLEAEVERTDDAELRVTLVQPNPGHDAPTGDLFRRLEVGYELRTEGGEVLRREATHLARHFEIVPGRPGRTLTLDNRVGSEPGVVELSLPEEAPSSARISWWVTYQRVATVGKGTNSADAIIESEVKLHSGEIPWKNQY